MSSLFLINFKKEDVDYNELNLIAINLVRLSIDLNIAVVFNSWDYGEKIINEAGMKNYCLLSDSFLYRNCEFLDTGNCDILNFESFASKFSFLSEIINKIFCYNVKQVEIYITEYVDSKLSEYKTYCSTPTGFLLDLHEAILELSEIYAYGFPTVKFNIYNKNLPLEK